MKKLILLAALAVSLTGCHVFKKPEPKVEHIKIEIPSVLTKDIDVPKPPVSPEEFQKLPYVERESILTRLSLEMYRNINEANLRFQAIRDLSTPKKEK